MSVDQPKGRPLGEGAAALAPTAPHATPREPSGPRPRRSGPERFWSKGPVRVALAVGVAVSAIAHSAVLPLGMPAGFEVKDVEGEADIPIDLLDSNPEPPVAPPPELPSPSSSKEDEKSAASAGAQARADAGARWLHDAGNAETARLEAATDAGGDRTLLDASAAGVTEAPDAALAVADAAADPHAVTGAVAAIAPKVINVVLVINAEVIRKHPVGATMGTLLRGIPQWDDFMSGTAIDPVRDTDWFMVSGPSLVNTERDVVLIHYSAPDIEIDRAVAIISHKYDRGGVFDVGVPGVKAVLAHADRAERVIMRPQPHVLAVVPPADAIKVAHQLAGARVKAPILPGEAVYVRLVNPQRPFPELPASITELRLRVVPRSDAGADVFIEGDTKDAESASSAAYAVARIVRRHNDMFTALLTHGLLDNVEVTAEGDLVKLHLSATLDQIQTLLALVESLLGIAPSAPGPSSVPTGLPSAVQRIPPSSPRGSLGAPGGIH